MEIYGERSKSFRLSEPAIQASRTATNVHSTRPYVRIWDHGWRLKHCNLSVPDDERRMYMLDSSNADKSLAAGIKNVFVSI